MQLAGEQKIIQLAAAYTQPREFIRVLEKGLGRGTAKERAEYFLQSGITLFKFSFFDLSLNSSNHALRSFRGLGGLVIVAAFVGFVTVHGTNDTFGVNQWLSDYFGLRVTQSKRLDFEGVCDGSEWVEE